MRPSYLINNGSIHMDEMNNWPVKHYWKLTKCFMIIKGAASCVISCSLLLLKVPREGHLKKENYKRSKHEITQLFLFSHISWNPLISLISLSWTFSRERGEGFQCCWNSLNQDFSRCGLFSRPSETIVFIFLYFFFKNFIGFVY